MMIRWIGQSGYVLTTATTEIIIDPYLSDIVNKVAGRARLVEPPLDPAAIHCDAVICTHDHLDHLDTEAVALMPENTYFITTGEGKEKLHSLGQNNVSVLLVGQTMTVGDITLIAVYANHTADAFGLIVKAEGKTLYFSGDTLFDEKLFEISAFHPDYTFICINGKLGNMNVEEAILTATKIGAPVNIPTHYGMFASNTEDPHKFADHIPGGRILEFNRAYEFPL